VPELASPHGKTGAFEKLDDSIGGLNVVLSARYVELLRMKQVWLYGDTASVAHLAETFEDFGISAFTFARDAIGACVARFPDVLDVDIGDVVFQTLEEIDSNFAVRTKVAGVKVEAEIRGVHFF
tara:strand:- start:3 stop:374 length:372 start_codon:yes stop_codon:yes gene_type:complete